MFPSVVACRRDDISSFVRAHMQRAIVQSRREWRHESCAPHIWHRSSVAIFLCSLTSSVGIECFASLHRKFLIFPGTFTDHKDFQDPSGSRTMHVVRLNKPSAAPVPPYLVRPHLDERLRKNGNHTHRDLKKCGRIPHPRRTCIHRSPSRGRYDRRSLPHPQGHFQRRKWFN